MGWWWSSSAPKVSTTPKVDDTSSPGSPEPTVQPPPIPRTLTREEQADADLQKLIREFQASESSSNVPPDTNASSAPSRPIASSARSETSTSIHPDSLYPTTMSCRDAFDYAFFCQSIGGQWVNVYRYGELRSCSEHWNNFWTCMRSRSYPKKEQEKLIRELYKKKDIKYRTGPSSEDVWDMRLEPVEGTPFSGDLREAERLLAEAKARGEVVD